MRKTISAWAIILAASTAVASPESRTRVMASGDWTLDKVDQFVVKDGRDKDTFDDMCVAQTRNGKVLLSLAMNAADADVSDEFRPNIYLQLSSSAWNFKFRETGLYFSEVGVFGAGNAWYYGDTIAFTIADAGYPEVSDFVETTGETVTVIGGGGEVRKTKDLMLVIGSGGAPFAELSTRGFKEAYYAMLDCAGQRK